MGLRRVAERYAGILRATVAANEEERRIVETLLLVARYEAGEESHVRETVDCSALLTRAVEEMQPVAEVNGIALHADIPNDALDVTGDPIEIRRAVLNLIANAIAATPERGTILVRGSGRTATWSCRSPTMGTESRRNAARACSRDSAAFDPGGEPAWGYTSCAESPKSTAGAPPSRRESRKAANLA